MKISLISTVKNEERNIKKFIDSVIKQTKKPDEFIIVDGGSEDKTHEILKEYAKKYKWIKVYQVKGANIAKGRNFAIKKAKNRVIAVVDAGTIYKNNWLEKLVSGFEECEADVGFGKTLPLAKNNFQKVLSKHIKQRFGSSRNIIFKKGVWEKNKGYPEDLKMAEDTVFNEKIKKLNVKIIKIPKAICYWEMRNNMNELKKQFYNYGYWDAKAYKKYKALPKHHKLAVVGLTFLIPLYPLFWFLSLFLLDVKIELNKRFSYLRGFWNGFLKK